jgi:N-acetylglucosamine repressor
VVHSRKVNSTLAKQINQQLVLQLIQGRGPISRRDIIQLSGLSPAAVSGITGVLIDLGLVQEVGEADSEGRVGRKAILLRLNPHAGYVVGVKLAVRTISCAITDLDANVLHYVESPLPFAGADGSPPVFYPPDEMIQATIRAVEGLLATAQIDRARVLGIGVGVNGIVNSAAGISVFAPHFAWRNVPVAAPLGDHFGIPVYLENDARALTVAEQWFGAGRGLDHFVTVAVGFGIGAGVVTNGQLYRGGSSGAGEFGHTVLQPDGLPCSCGRHGCLESLAAAPAILRQITEALACGQPSVLAGVAPLTLEAIARAAEAGDSLAQSVLTTAGHWLGVGLAGLINILNPQALIIQGEAVGFGRRYFAPMEAALKGRTFDGLTDHLRILVQPGGNEMWARGAACVVLGALFSSPMRQETAVLGRPRAFAFSEANREVLHGC